MFTILFPSFPHPLPPPPSPSPFPFPLPLPLRSAPFPPTSSSPPLPRPHKKQPVPPLACLTADFLSSQSKSSADELIPFESLPEAREGKNKTDIVCGLCKCKVMGPGVGSLVEKEVGFHGNVCW